LESRPDARVIVVIARASAMMRSSLEPFTFASLTSSPLGLQLQNELGI
jgi:hypothetical protein